MLFGLFTFGKPKPGFDDRPISTHDLQFIAEAKVNDQKLKLFNNKEWQQWAQVARSLGCTVD